MAKSRNRGGAKAHKKRVQKRNEKLGIQRQKLQKAWSDMYETKMKEIKEQFESLTATTVDEVDLNQSVYNSNEVVYEKLANTENENQESNSESKSE